LYLLLWTIICFLKQSRVAKRFPHCVQEYSFSALWLILWAFKLCFVVNRLSHTVHTYSLGLSSRGCWVISLLSALVFNTKELSPAQHIKHATSRLRQRYGCWYEKLMIKYLKKCINVKQLRSKVCTIGFMEKFVLLRAFADKRGFR